MIEDKVECINVIGELRAKIIANQVKKMNLGLKEMKAKVGFISVRVNLLTKLPRLITLKSMPPPGLLFKNQFYLNQRTNFCNRKFYCCKYYWQ